MIVTFDMACRMSAEHSRRMQAQRKAAEAYVLAKFPKIIVGSSGWWRAVEARMKK